jgi:hypothetical protein
MPLPLAAAALLAVNDHLLKGAGLLPGWLTGKLSDVAGLFVFPVLLFVALDVLTRGRSAAPSMRARAAVAVALVTALGFSAIKLSPVVNDAVNQIAGPMQLDPSDLLALPACALAALWLVRSRSEWSAPSVLRALAFLLVAFACIATSPPRMVRGYPQWRIESLGARRIGCAVVDVWVSKSGKQGFGVTIDVAPQISAGCPAEIRSARFGAGPVTVDGELPPPITARDKSYFYLPFAFDNERLWNDEHHAGRLEIVLQAGDREERLAFNLKHVWSGAHRLRERTPPSAPLVRPDAQAPLQFAEPPP